MEGFRIDDLGRSMHTFGEKSRYRIGQWFTAIDNVEVAVACPGRQFRREDSVVIPTKWKIAAPHHARDHLARIRRPHAKLRLLAVNRRTQFKLSAGGQSHPLTDEM